MTGRARMKRPVPARSQQTPGKKGLVLTRGLAKASQRRWHLSWEKRGRVRHVEGYSRLKGTEE